MKVRKDDTLDTMLKLQRTLQEKLGYDFNNMSDKQIVEYIKEYSLHMEHEMHEMLAELPFFKSWKKYNDNVDDFAYMFKKAEAEWIDVLHFFLNISIALGFDANYMFEAYIDKNAVNYNRQNDTETYKPCVEEK